MKPINLTRYTALVMLFLNSIVGFAQQSKPFKIKEIGTPFINTYNPRDYGAHEQTLAIDQAENGLMYFANVTGIIEFDGQKWEVDSRVSEDAFRDVVVGSDSRVYGVSKYIFGYFAPDEIGELVFQSLLPKTPTSFDNNGSLIKVDQVGEDIIFRSAESLLLYNIESDTISVIGTSSGFGESDKVGNQYYVMDLDLGLVQLKNNRLELVPGGGQFLEYTIRKIIRYADNQLLIVTKDDGLFLYDFKSLKPWKSDISEYLKSVKGLSGLNIHDQYFAIGTEMGGVLILDKAGRLIQKLDQSTGLPDNSNVLDLFLDQESNLWIAQHGTIHQVIINSPFTLLDERHGVDGYVLFFDKFDDRTFIGTVQDMVYKEDSKPWQKIGNYRPFKPVNRKKERVWMFVHHGKEFFAAGNGGMQQITEEGIIDLYSGEKLWAAVSMKNSDQIVMGSVEGNLHLFEKKRGRWEYAHLIQGFHQQMDFLEQTDDGDLWMTDSGSGVFKLHLNAAKDSVLSIRKYGPEDGLPDLLRNRVFRHKQGLLFATVRGVYRYDKNSDRFVGADEFNQHLGEDYVFRLIEMENGSIYGSLNPRGKALLRPSGKGFDFTQSPFQRIQEHNSEYVSGLGGSDIWIAGNGIRHYDSTFPNEFNTNFRTHIRSARISNKGDSLIYGGGQIEQSIELGPRENAIEFTYSSTFYDKIDDIQYQSYLEGSEETWAPWSSEPDRNYTNLPHGTYIFKVRARNIYGQLSEVDEYAFTIITPWYLTIWAYLIYAALIAFAIWGIVKINARRLINEKMALEKVVLERTEEITIQKEKAEEDKELIQQQADRLKELDKVKSRFFANISHELRTPLTLINAPLEALINNGEIDNELVRNTLKTAQRNGVSLLSLVEEILDLGKLEAGKLKLVENPVRLKEFLTDLLSGYQTGLAEKNIELKFDYWPKESLAIMMDENKCGKVVRNLLSNALKFTKDQISLSVQHSPEDPECMEIVVTDNGIGIHPNDLPYIFDRYYQSEQPGKKAEGGTGIGLALAKELAHLHGGSLKVKSELNQGTTFTFEFPAKEVKEETIMPLAKANSIELVSALEETIAKYTSKFEINKPVLLITEDHPEMRAFIAQTLDPYFEIRQAENGKIALDVLNSTPIDIVISDVMMPMMDGFELLGAIRKNESLHEVSVVMLTARADHEDKLHALTLGIDDYLTKPFSAEEFLARIKNILENRIKIIREFKGLNTAGNSQNGSSNLEKLEKKYGLSEREIEVMELLAKRYTNPEIAEKLFVSRNTVKYHIKNLFGKLNINSRIEAAEKIEEILG